jgi:hypothetical protein
MVSKKSTPAAATLGNSKLPMASAAADRHHLLRASWHEQKLTHEQK